MSPYVTLATGLRYSVDHKRHVSQSPPVEPERIAQDVRFSGTSSGASCASHVGQNHVSGGSLAGSSPTQPMWYQFDRSAHVLLSHAIMFPKLAPLQTQYTRALRFFLSALLLFALLVLGDDADDDLRLRGA